MAVIIVASGVMAFAAGNGMLRPGQAIEPGLLAGPLRLTVRLSYDRGRGQPLLAIGGPGQGTLIFWLWDADGQARIGVDDIGQGLSYSPPFSAAVDEPHQLEIVWGALAPLGALTVPGLPAQLRDLLWVSVDGRRLLYRKQAFPLRTQQVVFGANVIGSGTSAPFFNGTVAMAERGDANQARQAVMHLTDFLPELPQGLGAHPGPIELTVSLPQGVAGHSEPLISGGRPGAAALFYVHYDGERHMRIGYAAWGWEGILSEAIEYQPGAAYSLRLSAGFLYPPVGAAPQAGEPAPRLLPFILWVEWAGRAVLATTAPSPSVAPGDLVLGQNVLGWNWIEPAFGGLFSRVARLDPGRTGAAAVAAAFPHLPSPDGSWAGYPGAVRLEVTFPTHWLPGTGDPLVVAGTTGAADMVYVSYEEDGRLRISMDRWGWSALVSPSLAIAPGSRHVLTISMGALFPPEGSSFYSGRPALATQPEAVRVDLDGRTVLAGRQPPSHVSPGQIAYGINLAGGSTSGPRFTGRIIRIESLGDRVAPEARR